MLLMALYEAFKFFSFAMAWETELTKALVKEAGTRVRLTLEAESLYQSYVGGGAVNASRPGDFGLEPTESQSRL